MGRHRKPTHTGRNLAAVTASGAFLLPFGGVAHARVPGPDPNPPAARVVEQRPDEQRPRIQQRADQLVERQRSTGPARPAGVAPAFAAGSVWDRLADCESGGRWNINTGNGYSGGLQFAPSTWTGFGGREFAPVAHQATRAEQIVVATRVQAGQGWGAWPACTRKLGIRGAPPAVTPPPAGSGQRAAEGGYTVRAGDTLGRVADANGTTVAALAAANRLADPDRLAVGQRLTLTGRPAPAAAPRTTGQPAGQSAGRAAGVGGRAVAAARTYLGVPYRWGGTSRGGLDCSGLTSLALRAAGHRPPRTARAQEAWATRITAAQARPGDLVFYYTPTSHVGLYLGDGKMIHASRPGTTVSIVDVWSGARYGRPPA